MDPEKPINYQEMFQDLVTRRGHLKIQQQVTDVELVKVAQLLGAVYPLLSEKEQKQYAGLMEQIDEESAGLQDAIKLVFAKHAGTWLSAAHVRIRLEEMGFDFKHYRSNPLASIATTLKRMVPAMLEKMDSGSNTLYRYQTEESAKAGFKFKLGASDPMNRRGKK